MKLLIASSTKWVETVLANIDCFLLDHAACERKASAMAMSLVCHYPDRRHLVEAMTNLAIEELHHFKQVLNIIHQRDLQLQRDTKDEYVNALRKHVRTESNAYLLDRLLLAAIIEARGHERFGLIAHSLPEGDLKEFYQMITRSEERHFELFLELAKHYFPDIDFNPRLDELLSIEADVITNLPLQAALH